MKWPVLTADDRFCLRVSRSQAEKPYIVLCHSEDDSTHVQEAILPVLAKDGFKMVNGLVLKEANGLNAAILREAFPELAVADLTNQQLGSFLPDHRWIKARISQFIHVAKNRHGDQVAESFEGHRFIRMPSGESKTGNAGDLLLWDGQDNDVLAQCMDAFALQIAQQSTIKQYGDLVRFTGLISGKQGDALSPLMRPVQEGLEAALLRYQQRYGGLGREGFELALALHERQPVFEARTSSSVTLQQYSTPMPFNVLAQRIVGDVDGKSVLEPTIGNGSLVSQLPASARVFGADLDDRRLAQLQTVRPGAQVEHGDATTVNFRRLLGDKASQGYDVVLSNPPFGKLPNGAVQFDGKLKVTRIDHLILLTSLAARADQGVGVYIIGADSYVDSRAGEISGTSKYLFNYLQDHYQLDVIEVPGHFYGRQGASYPIRMLAIGDRFPMDQIGQHVQIDIEKPLPIIDSMDGLWDWANQMRDKYGLANEVLANPFVMLNGSLDDEVNRFTGSVIQYTRDGEILRGDVTRVLDGGQVLEVNENGTVQRIPWADVSLVASLVDNVKDPGASRNDTLDADVPVEKGGQQENSLNERVILGILFRAVRVDGAKRPAWQLENAVTGERYPTDNFDGRSRPALWRSLNEMASRFLNQSDEARFRQAFGVAEPYFPDVSLLLLKQRQSNVLNASEQAALVDELRALAAKVPVSDVQSVLGLDLIATRLDVDDLVFAPEPPEAPQVSPEPEAVEGNASLVPGAEVRFSPLYRALAGGIQARLIDDEHLDEIRRMMPELPDGWLIMNAARPIVGHITVDGGPFNAGRFYAAIDPDGEYAAQNVDTNRKLDARVLVPLPRETQLDMVLAGHRYEQTYREEYTDFTELYDAFDPCGRLHDHPASEILQTYDEWVSRQAAEAPMNVAEQEIEAQARSERNRSIAQEIYRQLGQMQFNRVTGAKDMVIIDNGLQFSLPMKAGYVKGSINRLLITLSPSDTYTVEGKRVRPVRGVYTEETVSVHEDVYVDQLHDAIEQMTGLATRMPRFASGVEPKPALPVEPSPRAPELPASVVSAPAAVEGFVPRDAWWNNLMAAREYANHLREREQFRDNNLLRKAWSNIPALVTLIRQAAGDDPMSSISQSKNPAFLRYLDAIRGDFNGVPHDGLVQAIKQDPELNQSVGEHMELLSIINAKMADKFGVADLFIQNDDEAAIAQYAAGINIQAQHQLDKLSEFWSETEDKPLNFDTFGKHYQRFLDVSREIQEYRYLSGAEFILELQGVELTDPRVNEALDSVGRFSLLEEAGQQHAETRERLRTLNKTVSIEEGKRRLASGEFSSPFTLAEAVFLSHGIQASADSEPLKAFVNAIEQKELPLVKAKLQNPDNKASMEIFTRLTGIVLGKTIQERMGQLDEWVGITPEQREKLDSEREARRREKVALDELQESWENLPPQINVDGRVMSVQAYITELAEQGHEITKAKKGVAYQYYLSSPDGEHNHFLRKEKSWNRFLKLASAFQDGHIMSALAHLGAVTLRDPSSKEERGPSAQMVNYQSRLNQGGNISPGLLEQIKMDDRLEKGEAEALLGQIHGDQARDDNALAEQAKAYRLQMLDSLKPFSQSDIELDKRLTKSDMDLIGHGDWYVGRWDDNDIKMTDGLIMLDGVYPSEIETLHRHQKFQLGASKDVSAWVDKLLEGRQRHPLTVNGWMQPEQESNAVVTMTTEQGEIYLVDEPLVRLAARKYADVRFVVNQGMVELIDLNDDTLGFIKPLSYPNKLAHGDFFEAVPSRLAELREAALEAPSKAADKTAPKLANAYQAPYEAGSKVKPSSSMIPLNLKTPVMKALARVEEAHGNIDQFVASELHWSVQEMGEYLSPEQIDAVALGIYAMERNRGLLEGDQTGLGKGRVMAAMARYAALRGDNTLFLTETPTLFSDLWRDITDIGSADLFRPFIVNDGVAIFDVISGKKVFQPTTSADRKAVLDSGAFPENCNLVLGTYSQFNRDRAASKKSRWLTTAAEGTMLLMDEAHNAAGQSNTGVNLQMAVEVAKGVIYSSATSMKDASNVMIYSKLFPDTVDLASMPDVLATGGEVLQEVLSSMLAEDGVFIRREHDLSNLTMTTVVDTDRESRNRVLSDKLASVLELMNYLSGDINQLVSERNEEIKKMLDSIPESERKGNRMGALSVNFGSRLFALYRQFLMTIKVDLTVERARDAVKAGQKPVIILENTMESLLKEVLFNDAGDDEELGESAAQKMRNEVLLRNLTFRDVLTRMLERISSYQETDRYGNVTRYPVESESALGLIEQIKEEISGFPDLPASPIDEIVNRLAEYGIFCDELSGRKTKLIKRGDEYLATSIVERPKATIVNDFNSGKSDAIILSRAGSTGISLHSSEKFKDQRQRRMIELQSAADVNKRVQFFGRVNRKGQVSDPVIETVSSGLIGEARPIAMQNAKLRKLSANTTSNQDNAALDAEIPDFLNALGDRIARTYLEQNPSIAQRLDIDIEGEGMGDDYFINKLTSRIVMLKVAEQEMIYDELTTSFVRELKALDAKGENPLKSREMDIHADIAEQEVETTGNPYSDSVFDQPIYLKNIEYKVKLNPLRRDDVEKLVEYGLADLKHEALNHSHKAGSEFIPGLVSYLMANKNTYLLEGMSKRFATLEAALMDEEPNAVQKTNERLRFICNTLTEILPGRAIKFTGDDGELTQGIVTRLQLPEKREQLHQAGKYLVRVCSPGMTHSQERSLYALMSDPLFAPLPQRMSEGVLYDIDRAPKGERLVNRLVLDGNLFGAAQRAVGLGNSVIYTDFQGHRQRGMMLSSGVDKEMLRTMPIRLDNPAIATEVLRGGVVLSDSPSVSSDKDKKGQEIRFDFSGSDLKLMVPGSVARGGHVFKDDELIKLVGEFTGTRAGMSVTVPMQQLEPVMKVLYSKGISMYASHKERERIEEIKMEVYANKSYDDGKPKIKMAG